MEDRCQRGDDLRGRQGFVIGTKTVPAGTYTLYTLPSPSAWQLIINKQTGQWGTVYDSSRDLVRIPMTVSFGKAPVEKSLIDFGQEKMRLHWNTTLVEVPIAEKK